MTPDRRRLLLNVLRACLGGTLVVVLIRSGHLQWSILLRLVDHWERSILALTMIAVALFLLALRLVILLRSAGFSLSVAASSQLTLIGAFFNTCLPGAAGGDVVRAYYATRGNPGAEAEIVTLLLFDRLLGVFVMLVWPVALGALFWREVGEIGIERTLMVAAAGAAVAMLVVTLAARPPRARWIEAVIARTPRRDLLLRVLDTMAACSKRGRVIGWALLLTLLSQAAGMGVCLVAAATLVPDAFSISLIAPISFGFLANLLPLTPGGLGVGEVAFDTLFTLHGRDGGAEVLLGWRFLMLAISLVGLVLYVSAPRRYVSRSLTEDDDPAAVTGPPDAQTR